MTARRRPRVEAGAACKLIEKLMEYRRVTEFKGLYDKLGVEWVNTGSTDLKLPSVRFLLYYKTIFVMI